MPAKQYIVTLTDEQRQEMERVSASNKRSLRERIRARILLLADTARSDGGHKDQDIAQAVRACPMTVSRVRRRFYEGGLKGALKHKEQMTRKWRLLGGEAEAHLIALTCSTPPDGRKRWSLHLLKDKLIEQRLVDTVSHETIRQTLKKTNSSPG